MNLEIEFYECKRKLNPSVLRIYSKNYLAKILLRVYIFLFSLMCKALTDFLTLFACLLLDQWTKMGLL